MSTSPKSRRKCLAIDNDEYSAEHDSGEDQHSVDREGWPYNHQVVVRNQKSIILDLWSASLTRGNWNQKRLREAGSDTKDEQC
jgi:hypothetical protein